jgi:hypothetical protein
MTTIENTRLTELESTIEHGLQTFVEVGNALMEIRNGRLYQAQYDTFEDYCRERWVMGRSYVNKLISASEVVQNLGTIVPRNELPQTESQARPLSQLTPDQQREVWPLVLETAPNGKPTAAIVESVVKDYNYLRDNRRSQISDIYTPLGMDACQTPAYAIDPLLPYLPEGLNIWEPACGEGLLEDALIDSGFHVVSSDILTGQNFFEYQPDTWDAIVTNPPYSIHFQWLERCYQLGKPFALLLKVEILGTKTAQEMFDQFGIEVIFVNPRINFKMPHKGWDGGGSQFPTAWFTFGLRIGKQITFAKVVPDPPRGCEAL